MASGVCVLLIMRKGFLEINTNSPRVSCRTFHLFSFTGISGPENLFLFFFKIHSFIYVWLCWVCIAAGSLSSCGEWGLLFSYGAWASLVFGPWPQLPLGVGNLS